jgi:hypothetical protein
MARPGRTGLNNSESTDDYLKAILELSGPEDNPVSSNALAQRLGVRAASVSGILGEHPKPASRDHLKTGQP